MSTTEHDNHQTLHKMADLLKPSAIRAAATLRLADHIEAGACRAEELARLTGTRADLLDMLLRYLASLGVLRQCDSGAFELADLGRPLLDSDPMGMRRLLSTDGMFGRADLALVNVLHTVRTGEPCYSATFGTGYWENINEDPAFVEALEQNGEGPLGWDADLILEKYDWSNVRRVVDVGGHSGTLLMELLRRQPHLHGTLVDLKNVAEVAGRRFARSGLADRCEARVGSFFEPLPTGGDVYVLSAILADWDDERAITILRRCGEAAGPDGRVLLAEVNLHVQETGSVDAAATELWLRAAMPAPVRSVEQLKALAEAAGLEVTWEGPATPVRSTLELRQRAS